MTLPPVFSFWTGGKLRWFDRLSLASFVHHGHSVTIYCPDGAAPDLPDGVNVASAETVLPEIGQLIQTLAVASVADFFRIRRLRREGGIWADTDVICLRPLVPQNGYLVGRQDGEWINNAVLALPQDSPALIALDESFSRVPFRPDWAPEIWSKLDAVPEDRRLATACRLRGNMLGPLALTHALTQSGEADRALPMAALNPVPWWLGDLYFNPRAGLDGWVDDGTLALHLYASRLRPLHRKRRPPKGSVLAKVAQDIGFRAFG